MSARAPVPSFSDLREVFNKCNTPGTIRVVVVQRVAAFWAVSYSVAYRWLREAGVTATVAR